MKLTKYLVSVQLVVLFFLSAFALAGDFDTKNDQFQYIKPLDQRLCNPPTLRLRCLITLKSHDWPSAQVPQEVRDSSIAFQNIHTRDYTASDLQTAFYFCAPTILKDKVATIDQRTREKLCQSDPLDAAIFDQKNLSVFDNLFFILESNCQKNINKGLIQLARFEHYRKRKVLFAILLNLGANSNYYGSTKHEIRLTTPLITATIHQHLRCVELLLKHKANPHEKEEDGYTAYTLAKRLKRKDKQVIDLLRSYGGFFIPVSTAMSNQKHTYFLDLSEDKFAFSCVLI